MPTTPKEFNFKNFFEDLIFHPEHGATPEDKQQAKIWTIVTGIFLAGTLHLAAGIYQLGCWICTKIERDDLTEVHKNTVTIAQTQGIAPTTSPQNTSPQATKKASQAHVPFKPDTTLHYVRKDDDLKPEEIAELDFFIEGMKTLTPGVSYVYSPVHAEIKQPISSKMYINAGVTALARDITAEEVLNERPSREMPMGWVTQAESSYASWFSEDPEKATSLQINAEKTFGAYLFVLAFSNVHSTFHMVEPPIKLPDPFPDVKIDDAQYPSVEAYFQNFKRVLKGQTIENEDERKAFYESCREEISSDPLGISDPYGIGYKYKQGDSYIPYTIDKKEWDAISKDVMRGAIYAKFTQNHLLREMLKATHPHVLLQLKTDPRWGPGANGEGENGLGEVLMEVREALLKGEVIPPYEMGS